MPKVGSDHLFRLIKSLNRAEIRYFKKTEAAKKHKDATQNILLFESLEKENEYEEIKIRTGLEDKIPSKNFAVAKLRLYEAVLNALGEFHSSGTQDATIKKEIHFAEILFKKSLYEQCKKVLDGARKKAEKFQKHYFLIEISQWEKRLIEKDNYAGISEVDLGAIRERDAQLASWIANFNDFWDLKSRFFMILNKGGRARSGEDEEKFKAVINDPRLNDPNKATTVQSRYLFHHIYSAYYFGMGEYQSCYEHLGSNISLMERNLEIFEEEPNAYFSVLTNAIFVGTRLKKYTEVLPMLDKLRKIPEIFPIAGNEDLELKLFSSRTSIEISFYNTIGDFEKGIELMEEIEEGIERFGSKINPVRRGFFYLNLAVACFGAGKTNLALRWINLLLNDSEIEENQDIHCFAKIFDLIVHLELGNEDLIPYTYKSTSRYLKKRKRVYRFESVFLDFVDDLMKRKELEPQRVKYEKLAADLKELREDKHEKAIFEYFDFHAWALAKSLRREFGEIIRETAGIQTTGLK